MNDPIVEVRNALVLEADAAATFYAMTAEKIGDDPQRLAQHIGPFTDQITGRVEWPGDQRSNNQSVRQHLQTLEATNLVVSFKHPNGRLSWWPKNSTIIK